MRRGDDLRVTVSTLQAALSLAHQRLREQQEAAAEVNRRLAETTAERDELEQRLQNALERAAA